MSTQMRVAEHPEGWAVFNGESPVKIGGVIGHPDRDALVADIESRGVFVWSDGSIQKEAEPRSDAAMVFAQDLPDGAFLPPLETVSGNESPGYTPPTPGPTEDPPVDPGADPQDPDPNPTVPVKPKRSRAKKVVEPADAEKVVEKRTKAAEAIAQAKTDAEEAERSAKRADLIEKADAIVAEAAQKIEETDRDAVKGSLLTHEESTGEKPAPKPRKPRAKKPEGAPRFNDEQKKARAAYAKSYRANMTEEQKEKARAAARERQRKWRETHPEKAAEFAKRSSERRRERYNEDPNFRQEIRSKQKQYAEAAKSSKG